MKLKFIFSIVFTHLVFGLILAANIGILEPNKTELKNLPSSNETAVDLTGEISVDFEIACLNQTPGPSITFTGSDSDDNLPYTFEYTINGGDVNTISTTDSSQSVSIEAPTSVVGEFTYTLISVTDSSNEIVTLDSEITITINSLPEVSFEIVSGDGACSGTPVVFNSLVDGDGPFSYAWSFGDGATSTNPNPSHVYEALGCGTSVFDVTLTVTDDNGCSSSASEVVNVLREPELEFFDFGATGPFDTPFKNCNPGSYLLTVGNISPDLDCIDSYDVAWGDGTIETGITASDFPIDHTYTTSGVFNLTFTALGDNGCVATEVIEVANSTNPEGGVINPGNTENLCAPAVELEFRISGWHDNPLDTQYIIDYGDGLAPEIFSQEELVASMYFDPPLDFPIPHTYIETNCPNTPFEINFEFVTACGTTSGTIGPISLVSPPDVSFEVPEIVCVNTPVEFINTSENGFAEDCSEFAQWFWNFGDGTPIIDVFTDTPQNITHVFTTPGIYTVSLTAFNPGWSVCPPESFTFEVCVEAPLEPLFSVTETEGCGPLTIEVSNNTDESNSCEEVDYLWTVTYEEGYCGNTSIYSFINGTDETSTNPQLLFEGPGIYTLTLSATNSCGTESTAQNIIVKAPPTITLDPIDNVCAPAVITPTYVFDLCDADNQEFNWIITGGTSPTDWEFIDGSNASSPNPTINFITPNTYTITVELTNECGTASSSQTFLLQPVPEITNTDLIQTICSGVQVDEIIFESTEPGTTFSWITTATANIDGEVASGSGSSIPAHVLTLNNDTSGCVTYSVTPSLGDCEGTTVDFVICVEPSPTFTLQPVGDSVCIDGVTPPLTVAYQDGTGTPTYEWFLIPDTEPVGFDPTYQPPTDQAGVFSYYVVISFPGNGGCSDITSDTVDITVVAPIETTNTPSVQDICVGGTPEELIVTNTTGAGNITYQWWSSNINTNDTDIGDEIPGATNDTYTPPGPFNTPGSFYYFVVISDDAAGCFDVPSGVYTINVVADPTVTIDPAGPLEYCQDAEADPLTAIPDGGIGTEYTYKWFLIPDTEPVGFDPTYTPPTDVVGVFSYYVEITQPASGCSNVSIPVEVTITLGPSITTQPVGDAVCIDGVTPPLTVAYQDGTGTPTYEWFLIPDTEPVGFDPTYQPPTDQAGVFSYYVVISFPGNGGCSDITSDTVDITVYQTPILSDFTTTICSGETFSIDPDETNGDIVPIGTTYTWSTPVINPVGAILGASGETAPQNNISQTLSNPISGVIATATYTVIPNSEICTGDPFTIVVTVNPQINVEAIVTNSACFEFDNAQIEITITGGVPFTTGDPFMIEWNGPDGYSSTAEDIDNLEPGTYTLVITDSEGCEFTDTYIITQPEELLLGSLDVFEDITCFGFDDGQISVTIIGGTLDYTYQWKRNGVDYPGEENLTNLPPGVYVLTVTDENDCVLVLDPLEIIEPELLTITLIDKVDIDCYGFNTGSIDIEANGGRPGYTYSWTGPAGFTSSDPDIFDLFPGTYTLVVTDTSGCTETLTEIIVQNDEITATINVTDVTCYGYNNGIIEIESIVGGVPFTTGEPYDILWSNLGSGLLQENLSPGIYTITITDALGCQRQYEIEVLEAPIFTLDPDVDQISCSGEDDGRIAINIVGGVAPLTVSWLDDPSAGIVRNNLPPGIYNVTVTDSSPIGPCVIEQEFVILPVAPLEISATVTDAFDCDDPNSGSINLSITGGTVSSTSSYSVTWSNGATTEDLINIGPGVYFVTVVDDNNCQITGQWEVNRFDPLDVTVTTETIADCDIRELYQVFTASTTGGIPDYTYLWSSGEVSGVNGEIMTATQNGTVTLTVTDSIGCIANYSFNVDLPEIGEVNFDQTSVGFINFGFYSILEPIQFINLTGGDYQVIIWDFGDGNFSNQENPTHTYTTPGTYTVTLTVTYPFGCTYTYTSEIIIEKGYKLVFPNAFTPNQDNLNDYFRPEYAGLNNIELRIFDTWGSQIYFESGNNISGCNGILKNKLAENGNYYYTFKAKTSYGEIILQDGPFTLIR